MTDDAVEILLVEDNKRDADLTIRALKRRNLGNNVVWLKDGEQALDYLFGRGKYEDRPDSTQPNVVLLDLKMPKVSGLDVLREIRGNKQTREIPVVMLTSSNEERDIIESYEQNVNSYIVKPVDFEKFMEAIEYLGFYWIMLNKPPQERRT